PFLLYFLLQTVTYTPDLCLQGRFCAWNLLIKSMAMVDSPLPSRLKELSQEAFIYICIVSIRTGKGHHKWAYVEVHGIHMSTIHVPDPNSLRPALANLQFKEKDTGPQ
ncbi:hypothetical protein M8C21_005259, partial [Ambrosia artemisiifolia]